MARTKAHKSTATKKISETFLEFVGPFMEELGAGATDHQLEQMLQVGFTVWNAVVFDAVNATSRFVDQVRDLTAHDPAVGAFVEELIARKRRLFGDDQRLIGQYQLYRNGGELRLRAEARRPSASTLGPHA